MVKSTETSAREAEKNVLCMLACIAHGSDVEKKTYGEMADAMQEHMHELGYGLFKVEAIARLMEKSNG